MRQSLTSSNANIKSSKSHMCVCVTSVILTQSSDACFHRKAVKATLVLLPLLGITYMLFFVNPGEDDIAQIVFIYFNSFLQSFQVRRRITKRWGASQMPVNPHARGVTHAARYLRAAELLPSRTFQVANLLMGRWCEAAPCLCLQTIKPSCLLRALRWQD